MNPADVWNQLEKDPRIVDVKGRVQRRIMLGARRNFFLGLEIPSRDRILILRVSAKSIEGQPIIPDSRGLVVRVALRDGASDEAEVVLALKDPEYEGIFDLLVDDLVSVAEEQTDERDGVTQFLARLANWQQLLRRLGSGGLSREAQIGLWGELWVLREVVGPVAGVQGAVDGWRGPLGADQDFQLGGICIEVKASTATSLESLAISSERQLDVPDDVQLILFGLSLDARPKHGETLPEIVQSVRAKASEIGILHLLDPRLELAGYSNTDNETYGEVGYTVRSIKAFRVECGFPRIVAADLPNGITDVSYVIALTSCDEFQLAECCPEKTLEGLV